MPTYAQLQTESWWGREIQTPELAWFGEQLCAALGVGRDHFGTKGDNAHLNGGHRSQEWITNSRWCTNRTDTAVSGRTGEQTRHIAAFDITPRTRDQMLAISRNLDKVTRAGQLEEVVEWYGNTNDDQRVDGWNNIRNAVASSDSSHLWHLHGTFDRRVLRDRNVMQRTLNALLHGTATSTPGDDDMAFFDDSNAAALGYRVDALASGSDTSRGGPVKGENVWLVGAVKKVQADLAALRDRPSADVTMTPADREAVVNGIVGGLVTNTAFLAAVAKAVADENARRQQA